MTITITHGIRLYAVDSRDVGMLGGRAARATIKVYDGSCANSPRVTISDRSQLPQIRSDLKEFNRVGDREMTNRYLRRLLPSSDPYSLA